MAMAAQIAAIIRAAGKAVAGILGAIANKDLGQGISALAPLAGLIPVAGPFIEAGLQIVGGVVSFFAAAATSRDTPRNRRDGSRLGAVEASSTAEATCSRCRLAIAAFP